MTIFPRAVGCLAVLCCFQWAFAEPLSQKGEELSQEFDWSSYQQVLQQHVAAGERYGVKAHLVDYNAVLSVPGFARTKQALSAFIPTFRNEDEKIAFYINAYNYLAIVMVAEEKPEESIKDIGSFFFPVWGKNAGAIGGKPVTLDHIEHEVLRSLGEPRIHFALVCASMSCPNLRRELYTAEKLDDQLDEQVIAFLNDETKGSSIKNGKLYLSSIFQWFKSDFVHSGGVLEFVYQYKPEYENFGDYRKLKYNWKLNGS